MKTKNKSRMIIFFVIISMLLMALPTNMVSALSSTHTQDFNNQIDSTPFNTSLDPLHEMYMHRKSGTTFMVSSADRYGASGLGFQASKLGDATDGWINLSYSPSLYLTNFTFLMNAVNLNNLGAGMNICFYNKTAGQAHSIVTFAINFMGMYYYKNSVSQFTCSVAPNRWIKFGFEITTNHGETSYFYNDSHFYVSDYADNSSLIYANRRIDRIYWDANALIGDVKLDDLSYVIADSYTPGGGGGGQQNYGCGIDFSPYTVYKTMPDDSPNLAETSPSINYQLYHYIETAYYMPMKTRIWGVSILIGINQYSNANLTNDYEMTINGISMGTADCFENYGNDYTWRITWDVSANNITLNNDYPVFSFYCLWGWKVPYITGDIRYFSSIKLHDNPVFYNDEVWEGTELFIMGSKCYLPMRFYTGNLIVTPGNSGYKDSIETSYNSYDEYTSISLLYKINTTAQAGATTYITIYGNGAEISYTNQHIPYQIPAGSFEGQTSFTAMYGGTYKLHLERNGVNVSTKTITIHNVTSSYSIWANPNPCMWNSGYVIGYRYYNPNGKQGIIALYYDANLLTMDFVIAYKYYVDSNTSDNVTRTNIGSDKNIAILFVNAGNLIYDEVDRITIDCITVANNQNTIHVDGTDPHVIPKATGYVTIRISGTTQYVGLDVYVTLNGKRIYPIGNTNFPPTYLFDYNISENMLPSSDMKLFNASLMLSTTNGTSYLCSTIFTVETEDKYKGEGGGNDYGIFGPWIALIPAWAYIFIAIGIIVGFAFMPFIVIYSIISSLKNKTGIELHVPGIAIIILSAITSIIGYTLDIVWGLLAWWTVFLLLFVLILVFSIFYYSRKNEGNQ